MKNILLLVSFLGLAACAGGGGGGSSSAPGGGGSQNPGVTVNTYVFRVSGEGQEFVGVLYTNFGEADQTTTPISQQVISGGPYDYTVSGRNAVGQFAFRGGSGTLTIQVYKNGALIDADATSTLNQSLDFAIDAQ